MLDGLQWIEQGLKATVVKPGVEILKTKLGLTSREVSVFKPGHEVVTMTFP